MKEHSILFKGPLVRAILEGRKTVTRRAIKPEPQMVTDRSVEPWRGDPETLLRLLEKSGQKCPFGQPGDRLWVRETWGVISHTWDEDGNMIDWAPDRPATPVREMPFGLGYYSGHVIYAADGPMEWAGDDDGGGDPRSAWKPSIHMPRKVCRLLLEVTDVRVERLQDITDSQIMAEGVDLEALADGQERYDMVLAGSGADGRPTLRTAWRDLWNSTGGDWDANPWVWVIEFKRVEPEPEAGHGM